MKTLNNQYVLNILVGGKPIIEYQHEGNVFVEGRRGSEFEIEFINNSSSRVLFIPAVDGKSVLDGQPATPESKGYVVGARSKVVIPGWTLNGNEVAKFFFEDKEKSYAARTSNNLQSVQAGVIGALIYQEKTAVSYNPWYPTPYPYYPTYPPGVRGTPYWSSPTNAAGAVPLGTSTMGNMSVQTSVSDVSIPKGVVSNPAPVEDVFEMGTGFGERADFKVNQTTFNRVDTITAQLVIYYDSKRNLSKRGIEVSRRGTQYINELPQPFSGIGCVPPKDWRG